MFQTLSFRAFAILLLAIFVGSSQNLRAQEEVPGRDRDREHPIPRTDKEPVRTEKQRPNRARGGDGVDPDSIPTWTNDTREAGEAAITGSKALLIVFLDESDTQQAENYFTGKDIADISKAEAIFVRVAYNKDRAPAPDAPQNIIPVSKFQSDNPSREYRVASYPTFIVADSYGNEVMRFTSVPTASALKSATAKIAAQVDSASKKLQKNLEAAKKTWETKDYGKTLKSLALNFKEGVTGLPPQKASIDLYNELVEAARAEIADLTPEGEGAKRMTELKNAFKSLDKGFAAEIDAILKKK
ncbi:MAG: hypothetical protein IT462_13690 [Planctomycetes bacterium]|nr:hypothetical protein [Planctomycetota bacterium]